MVTAYHHANLDFQKIRTFSANPFIMSQTLLWQLLMLFTVIRVSLMLRKALCLCSYLIFFFWKSLSFSHVLGLPVWWESMNLVDWPWLAAKHSCSHLLTPRLSPTRSRDNRKKKAWKLVGSGKDNLISGGKRKKRCKGSHMPPPAGRPMPSQFPNSSHLGNQNLTFFFSPHFLSLIIMLHGMEYSFGHLGQLSRLCHLPVSCTLSVYLLQARGSGEKRKLDAGATTVQP